MVNKELSVMEELMLNKALMYQLVRAKETVEYWLYKHHCEQQEQWLKISLDEFYASESLCQMFNVALPDDVNLEAFKQRLSAELSH